MHSPLQSRTFKTEMQHTPLKAFTKKLVDRKKSVVSAPVLLRDSIVEKVVTDLILDNILREVLRENRISEANDRSFIQQTEILAVYDGLLESVMRDLMLTETVKPVVEMHNNKPRVLHQIQQKCDALTLEQNTTLVHSDSELHLVEESLQAENSLAVIQLVREVAVESMFETLISEFIETSMLTPTTDTPFRQLVREVAREGLKTEVELNAGSLLDSALEQILHKVLI